MTVEELRAKLATLPGQKQVVVYWEQGNEQHFCKIDSVSIEKGTPKEGGKRGFTFDSKGQTEWVFIEVSPE